jgi:hypothetical protein
MEERIRWLTDLGPSGQLGCGRWMKLLQKGWKSPEQMMLNVEERKNVGRSPVRETL